MRIVIAVLAVTAVALSACGSGEDPDTSITARAAKATIERSARIHLAPQPVPAEARLQGLESAFTGGNAGEEPAGMRKAHGVPLCGVEGAALERLDGLLDLRGAVLAGGGVDDHQVLLDDQP